MKNSRHRSFNPPIHSKIQNKNIESIQIHRNVQRYLWNCDQIHFFFLQNKWSVDTSKWQTLVIAGIFMGVNSFKIYNFIEIIWIGLQKKKQKDTKVIFFMDFKIDLKFDISANTKKKRKWKLFNLVRKLALRIVFRSTE